MLNFLTDLPRQLQILFFGNKFSTEHTSLSMMHRASETMLAAELRREIWLNTHLRTS